MRTENITKSRPKVEVEPYLTTDFRLGSFKLTLLYDHVERKGIQIGFKEFTTELRKYDKNNPNCPYDYNVVAINQDFGVYSVSKDSEPVALYERQEKETSLSQEEFQNQVEKADFMSKATVCRYNLLYQEREKGMTPR